MARPEPIERPVEGAPDAPPRYLPDVPFPPYRFVPGHTPHPYRQPGGWAYGSDPPVPPYVPREEWTRDDAYLRGVDFFNRGWWWEAHEVWEGAWHVVEGRDRVHHDLLKGLIQLAGCALNRERGHDGPADTLLGTARALLGAVREAAGPRVMGLDLGRLDARALAALGAPTPRVDGLPLRPVRRVLFLCTHNSARSQMAEGLLRHLGAPRFEALSAGTERTRVREDAIAVMAELGIDLSTHESKTLDAFLDEPIDDVITVCDAAREACPAFPRARRGRHWSFPDPSRAEGDDEARRAVYREVRDAIRARIEGELLVPVASAP